MSAPTVSAKPPGRGLRWALTAGGVVVAFLLGTAALGAHVAAG